MAQTALSLGTLLIDITQHNTFFLILNLCTPSHFLLVCCLTGVQLVLCPRSPVNYIPPVCMFWLLFLCVSAQDPLTWVYLATSSVFSPRHILPVCPQTPFLF